MGSWAPGLHRPGRPRSVEELGDPDLVLTTYCTLRRDAALLARAESTLEADEGLLRTLTREELLEPVG